MTKILLSLFILCTFSVCAQNSNWGTGLPVTATLNGNTLIISVFDPLINQTQTTNITLGNNPIYQNIDGIVVASSSSNGTMYYATYDLDLHSWAISNSSMGNSVLQIKTADGVVVGSGSSGSMYYATYDIQQHNWAVSNSSMGTSVIDIKTADGVVVGSGNSGSMYYATYDVEQHNWKVSNSSMGTSVLDIKTADGVVVGAGSSGSMYYAVYDIELHNWIISNSSTSNPNIVIETSDGVVIGKGINNYIYFSIYDYNINTWQTNNLSMGTNGAYNLTSGTITYSGSNSGTRGYNPNNQSWGSTPTIPQCKLLPISFSGSNWVFMQCKSMGASTFTYSAGDGHQIYRKLGWKKYNSSNTFNIDLNISNGIGNSTCNKSINITTSTIDYLNNSKIDIYPNPSSDKVTIKCDEIKNLIVKIFDIYGERNIESTLLNGSVEINVSTFNKGIYIIKISGDGNRNIFRKLLIE